MKVKDLGQVFIYEDDVVLDPFMGSGTTMVSCIREHRRYVGFELSEKYFDIAQRRIQEEKYCLF